MPHLIILDDQSNARCMVAPVGADDKWTLCSCTICEDMHPIAKIFTETIPWKQMRLNLAHAVLRRWASPLSSCAPIESTAMFPRVQAKQRKKHAEHAAQLISSPKNPWHFSNLASTGSVPKECSSFMISRLTSKAQHGEQSPHPRQVTSAHKKAFGQFCSP